MPDDIGVRVWRRDPRRTGFPTWHAHPGIVGEAKQRETPYLAIPLDAESLAELRMEVERTINDVREQGLGISSTAAAVLAALGLDPS